MASFTDAALAQNVATNVLATHYRRTSAGWQSQHPDGWVDVPDGVVMEAVRRYILDQYALAQQNDDENESKGWHEMQSASRMKTVLGLSGYVDGVYHGEMVAPPMP
jgi:hypothetical protein